MNCTVCESYLSTTVIGKRQGEEIHKGGHSSGQQNIEGDEQQGFTVKYRELYSISCDNL